MLTKFARWMSSSRRWFGTKSSKRPVGNKMRPTMERLETRTVPAIFTGGVSVAGGDVSGDGFSDIVTGAGPGGSPLVKVFSGKNGAVFRQFNAFESTFTGGVFVAVGDVNGDGRPDIITGAGQGGSPRVKVFDGKTGAVLLDFLAYSRRFHGGVRVAAADITGDGKADIITGAGPGGGPQVEVFNGTTGKIELSITAFDKRFTGGVYVAGGDITGDGRADIVAGAGEGGAPIVSVFDSKSPSTSVRNFFAYDPAFRGGVRVGVADITPQAKLDIVTGAGPGGGPHVLVYSGETGQQVRSYFPYSPTFRGGVFVATGVDINGVGAQDLITGAGSGGGPHVIASNGDNLAKLTSFFAYEPNSGAGAFAVPRDAVPPTVTITSPTDSPTQKTNLTVTGKAADDRSGLASVQVSVDNGAFQNVSFNSTGAFTFTTSFGTTGGSDGKHNLRFRATDKAGNQSSIANASFTLDTFVTPPSVNLAPESDTGVIGDLITATATVNFVGTTDPNVDVTLVAPNMTAKSDASGKFRFDGISLTQGANTFTFRATDSLGNSRESTVTVTLNSAPTVTQQIADVTVPQNSDVTIINLSNNFNDVDIVNSIVRFNTNEGPIDVELFDKQTPLTVANFLNYVTGGDYTTSIFHRLVNNFVLQGGGFKFNPNGVDGSSLDPITTDPPVLNEPGISNQRGTIAMAKLGNDPNSATSQFFFNLGDNSANLDNQNGGFTVFGHVTSGMEVVDKLATYSVFDQGGVFNEIPLQNYNGTNFPSDTVFRNYAGLNNVSLVRRSDRLSFSVTGNDNPSLVTTSVSGNNLTLSYAAGQTGTAHITVRATDLDGQFVETTFTVTVG
jgi:cyclophilin family peptidyl-prolyl cis-trans isomerase